MRFYYLSAEHVVPDDAEYVIIGGSVTVVPPYAFEGYRRLKRVGFQEGVKKIGTHAFARCPNLERIDWASSIRTICNNAFLGCVSLSEVVPPEGLEEIDVLAFVRCRNLECVDCPSSLRKIGAGAFKGCGRLSKVVLREGLELIAEAAFKGCALERITVPSSVHTIFDEAFSGCHGLSEVNLMEGLLRLIGKAAFKGCDLRRIALPSSVKDIWRKAFAECDRLSEVTLAGGTVMVARKAFFCCPRLRRISFPSMAIVVRRGEDGNGRVAAVTGGIRRDSTDQSPQLILASPHLVSMRPEELTNLTDAIDRIVHRTRRWESAHGAVSACFVNHLSRWYDGYKREVATILELRLWKIEMGRAREARQARAAGGGKRARADVPTRDDSRRACGAEPIVGLVLSSLTGPHRRAGQAENAGSTQP